VLLTLSLLANLVFVPLGAWAMYRRWRAAQARKPVSIAAAIETPQPRGFPATADYAWPQSLFSAEPVQPGAIVFLGDSLVAGGRWEQVWPGPSPAPVLNRGIAGDTMDGVLGRLDEALRHRPRALFVMAGINDLRFEERPPEWLAGKFRELVERARAASPDTSIHLMALLPVWGEGNAQVRAVNVQLAALAAAESVQLIDLGPLVADASGELDRELSFDGVHLRAAGYAKWREAVRPLVGR
jgi:lysophospholipase L1-like esterase